MIDVHVSRRGQLLTLQFGADKPGTDALRAEHLTGLPRRLSYGGFVRQVEQHRRLSIAEKKGSRMVVS